MMSLIQYFNNLFPAPPSDEKVARRRDKIVGTILSRYSEGNINLNRGKYISKHRAGELKKKALSYNIK